MAANLTQILYFNTNLNFKICKWFKEKCLKMQPHSLELLFYFYDCLKIYLKENDLHFLRLAQVPYNFQNIFKVANDCYIAYFIVSAPHSLYTLILLPLTLYDPGGGFKSPPPSDFLLSRI